MFFHIWARAYEQGNTHPSKKLFSTKSTKKHGTNRRKSTTGKNKGQGNQVSGNPGPDYVGDAFVINDVSLKKVGVTACSYVNTGVQFVKICDILLEHDNITIWPKKWEYNLWNFGYLRVS